MVWHPDGIEPAVFGGADEGGGFLPADDALGFGKMQTNLDGARRGHPEKLLWVRIRRDRLRVAPGIVRVSGCASQPGIRLESTLVVGHAL
jgi:hypothetical protein